MDRFSQHALAAGLAASMAFAFLPSARADGAPPGPTPFDQAKALMKEEHFNDAIPKLLESIAHEKTVGALFNLGVCYEKTSRTASAWTRFKQAEALAREKSDPRENDARARASTLEAHLSKITITVPPGVDVPGLEVKRDGVVVPREEWNVAVPIDAGTHLLEATGPGKKTWSREIAARASGGDWTSVVVGPLNAPEETSPAPAPRPPPETPHGLGTQRIGAVAAAGAGVVAIGLGTVFVISGSSKYSDSKAHCTNPADANACDASGVDLRDSARSAGNVATVAFIVGGVALAAGAALWLTGSSSKSTTAVGLAPGGILLKGTW